MNTRKKTINTVYRDDDESETEDFSASASDAEIPEHSSSEGDDSAEDFAETSNKSKRTGRGKPKASGRKPQFAKRLLSRLTQCVTPRTEEELETETPGPVFSVKDLTEEDKLLPAVLNLSESDSSDDEYPTKKAPQSAAWLHGASTSSAPHHSDSESEIQTTYNDVWSKNAQDSEEVAKKSFEQLQKHTNMLQQTKTTIEQYRTDKRDGETNVEDLLALGEEEVEEKLELKKIEGSGSEEDWEEVNDSKPIPQSGIQLIVDFPDAANKKSKQVDVEMMMRRKINRVKKEYQVYMHKVHVLCWLGHGNYVNRVLNDQDVMATALSLLPSDKCYPTERVNTDYVIQISKWYRDKMRIQPEKNENKFKPNAPPLKEILLKQIRSKVVTSTKMLCYIFISMLRALGIQCRVMMNFVTVPIRPPGSELCSLATKHKTKPDNNHKPTSKSDKSKKSVPQKVTAAKLTSSHTKSKISQLDGTYDSSTSTSSMECSDLDEEMIIQLDGNNDTDVQKPKRNTRANRLSLKSKETKVDSEAPVPTDEDVSPAKRQKQETESSENKNKMKDKPKGGSRRNAKCHTGPNNDNLKVRNEPKRRSPRCEGRENSEVELQELESGTSKSDVSGDIKESQQLNKSTRNKGRGKTETFEGNGKLNLPNKTELTGSTSRASKSVTMSGDSQSQPTTAKSSKTNISRAEKVVKKDTTKSNDKPKNISSEFFQKSTRSGRAVVPKIQINSTDVEKPVAKVNNLSLSRKRGRTSSPGSSKEAESHKLKPSGSALEKPEKLRTRSAPGKTLETSKYFNDPSQTKSKPLTSSRNNKRNEDTERVSHRDLLSKSPPKTGKMDVKKDIVQLIKGRVREAKSETKRRTVKGKAKEDSDDSDYLPVETKLKEGSSENEFKPKKKYTAGRKAIDRRVLSSDDETAKKKMGIDVWCEVFVEEEELWISVDIVQPLVHCVDAIYTKATHPVSYIVGWDNGNRLKDLTRRYVPNFNTVTRKQRAEQAWWRRALEPWLGVTTHRDREEDEQLDKIMFDAPLPKSIAEYKNHPLYVLKRHLLKFEALYPAEAPPLGFVRGEAVYARDCVYTCRSRDTWLKDAKTVRMGEKPYKVVKARPKWDRLSNKMITDIPLEVFGPWQVQDYEPPTAEGGVVPRNAYGNVELFKLCMLPKGTVHVKLPGLNKVAKKLNVDCAPAMTGFDFHGGWTHPVFDGFVVCSEFEELLTDAWVKDQEEMERREREKVDVRVYGNWKKLIKGLLIRERLQQKYAFEDPNAPKKKSRGPRLLVKK